MYLKFSCLGYPLYGKNCSQLEVKVDQNLETSIDKYHFEGRSYCVLAHQVFLDGKPPILLGIFLGGGETALNPHPHF